MEIKTKFDVGQKVYRLKHILRETKNRTYEYVYVLDTIKTIYMRTNVFTKIIYCFDNTSLGCVEALEKNCFATEAEAQAECNRRNNENKI